MSLTSQLVCLLTLPPPALPCPSLRSAGHNFNKIIEYESPMAVYQTRSVAVFHDKSLSLSLSASVLPHSSLRTGYALGSIEGRVAIEHFNAMGVSRESRFSLPPRSLHSPLIQDQIAETAHLAPISSINATGLSPTLPPLASLSLSRRLGVLTASRNKRNDGSSDVYRSALPPSVSLSISLSLLNPPQCECHRLQQYEHILYRWL
jgi:hypothetical protein